MRCVAVDWSGRQTDAAESIWIAEARDEKLTFLENGRSRDETVSWLIDQSEDDLVVGLDFAFSFPAWFCRDRGWATGPAVWSGVDDGLLEEAFPFWGRTKPRPPLTREQPALRADDARLGAKSVFQIGGAGAVGTGSVRGMPCLARLREAGFVIWPFDPPRPPLALEIYPRALYGPGPVVKTRWRSRHAALTRWFPDHPARLLERAAGSEDAFDAAISALAMSRHARELATLRPVPEARIEGRVWTPDGPAAAP